MIKTITIITVIIIINIILTPFVFAQSPSPVNPEEQGVYKFNINLPKEAVAQPESPQEQNILQGILSGLTNLIGGLIGLIHPVVVEPPKFYTHSESIHQTEAPPELKPTEQSAEDRLKKLLGGFYDLRLLHIPGVDYSKVSESEKLYEDAYFYEKINPITDTNP